MASVQLRLSHSKQGVQNGHFTKNSSFWRTRKFLKNSIKSISTSDKYWFLYVNLKLLVFTVFAYTFLLFHLLLKSFFFLSKIRESDGKALSCTESILSYTLLFGKSSFNTITNTRVLHACINWFDFIHEKVWRSIFLKNVFHRV